MRGTFNLASVPLIISFSIASLFLKGKKIEILTKGLNISIYSLFTCYHADSYLIMKILPVLLVAFILLILVTLRADAEVVTVESKWPTVISWSKGLTPVLMFKQGQQRHKLELTVAWWWWWWQNEPKPSQLWRWIIHWHTSLLSRWW